MDRLQRLDCQGCASCRYEAIETDTKNQVVFWYNQCDADGMCYSLNSQGLADDHPIAIAGMVGDHKELEDLIFRYLENVTVEECDCDESEVIRVGDTLNPFLDDSEPPHEVD